MSDATGPELLGFGVANYRSFDNEGFFVEDLCKINVFIGKNNSGKSNILRAIRMVKRIETPKMRQGIDADLQRGLGLEPTIDSHMKCGTPPSVTICTSFKETLHRGTHATPHADRLPDTLRIRWNTLTGKIEQCESLETIKTWGHAQLNALLGYVTGSRFAGPVAPEKYIDDIQSPLLKQAIDRTQFFPKLICVENFREIRNVPDAETDGNSDGDSFNGHNVIKKLREMQHPRVGEDSDQTIFDRIQDFVRGLLLEPTLKIEIPPNVDEIIVNIRSNRLPLESYGTGLHQLIIICAALAMHDDYVVCIEEPEIHIHPELQRRFLQFIASETNHHYFITTHSNVFLDFLPDVAIFHVTHDGMKSSVTRVEATENARNVLADLGYKASDLLQANCVIWVEGPTDRIYLNKWLSLAAPDLIEGIHYAVTFYGGKVLAHFSAVDDPADDLVEVLRINQHAIFIMDRDAVKTNGWLNSTKERIQGEIGEAQCWVTEGREIENYLRSDLLTQYFRDELGKEVSITCNKNSHLEKAIAAAMKDVNGPKVNYANAKVAYARKFCENMTEADLDVLDLRDQIENVVRHVREWNHISTADEKSTETDDVAEK